MTNDPQLSPAAESQTATIEAPVSQGDEQLQTYAEAAEISGNDPNRKAIDAMLKLTPESEPGSYNSIEGVFAIQRGVGTVLAKIVRKYKIKPAMLKKLPPHLLMEFVNKHPVKQDLIEPIAIQKFEQLIATPGPMGEYMVSSWGSLKEQAIEGSKGWTAKSVKWLKDNPRTAVFISLAAVGLYVFSDEIAGLFTGKKSDKKESGGKWFGKKVVLPIALAIAAYFMGKEQLMKLLGGLNLTELQDILKAGKAVPKEVLEAAKEKRDELVAKAKKKAGDAKRKAEEIAGTGREAIKEVNVKAPLFSAYIDSLVGIYCMDFEVFTPKNKRNINATLRVLQAQNVSKILATYKQYESTTAIPLNAFGLSDNDCSEKELYHACKIIHITNREVGKLSKLNTDQSLFDFIIEAAKNPAIKASQSLQSHLIEQLREADITSILGLAEVGNKLISEDKIDIALDKNKEQYISSLLEKFGVKIKNPQPGDKGNLAKILIDLYAVQTKMNDKNILNQIQHYNVSNAVKEAVVLFYSELQGKTKSVIESCVARYDIVRTGSYDTDYSEILKDKLKIDNMSFKDAIQLNVVGMGVDFANKKASNENIGQAADLGMIVMILKILKKNDRIAYNHYLANLGDVVAGTSTNIKMPNLEILKKPLLAIVNIAIKHVKKGIETAETVSEGLGDVSKMPFKERIEFLDEKGWADLVVPFANSGKEGAFQIGSDVIKTLFTKIPEAFSEDTEGVDIIDMIIAAGGVLAFGEDENGNKTGLLSIWGDYFFIKPINIAYDTMCAAISKGGETAMKTYLFGSSSFVAIGATAGLLSNFHKGLVSAGYHTFTGALRGLAAPITAPISGYRQVREVGRFARLQYNRIRFGLDNLENLDDTIDLYLKYNKLTLSHKKTFSFVRDIASHPLKMSRRLLYQTYYERMHTRWATQFTYYYNDFIGVSNHIDGSAEALRVLDNVSPVALAKTAKDTKRLINRLRQIDDWDSLSVDELVGRIRKWNDLDESSLAKLEDRIKKIGIEKFRNKMNPNKTAVLYDATRAAPHADDVGDATKVASKADDAAKRAILSRARTDVMPKIETLDDVAREMKSTQSRRLIMRRKITHLNKLKQGGGLSTMQEARLVDLEKRMDEIRAIHTELKKLQQVYKKGGGEEAIEIARQGAREAFRQTTRQIDDFAAALVSAESDLQVINKQVTQTTRNLNAAKRIKKGVKEAQQLLADAKRAQESAQHNLDALRQVKNIQKQLDAVKQGSVEASKLSRQLFKAQEIAEDGMKVFKGAIDDIAKAGRAGKWARGLGIFGMGAGAALSIYESSTSFYEAFTTDVEGRAGLAATNGGLWAVNAVADTAGLLTFLGVGGTGVVGTGLSYASSAALPLAPLTYAGTTVIESLYEETMTESEWAQEYEYDALLHKFLSSVGSISLADLWIVGAWSTRSIDENEAIKAETMYKMFRVLVVGQENPALMQTIQTMPASKEKDDKINEIISQTYTKNHEYYLKWNSLKAQSLSTHQGSRDFITNAKIFNTIMKTREMAKANGSTELNLGPINLMDDKYEIGGSNAKFPKVSHEFSPDILIEYYKADFMKSLESPQEPHISSNLEKVETPYLLRLWLQMYLSISDQDTLDSLQDDPHALRSIQVHMQLISNYLLVSRGVECSSEAVRHPEFFHPRMNLEALMEHLNDLHLKAMASYQDYETLNVDKSPGVYAMYRLAQSFGYGGGPKEETLQSFFSASKSNFVGIYFDDNWHVQEAGFEFDEEMGSKLNYETIEIMVNTLHSRADDILEHSRDTIIMNAFDYSTQVKIMAGILQSGYSEGVNKFTPGKKTIGYIAPKNLESKDIKADESFETTYASEIDRIAQKAGWRIESDIKNKNEIVLSKPDSYKTTTLKRSDNNTWQVESYQHGLNFSQAVAMGNFLNQIKHISSNWEAGTTDPFEIDGNNIDFDKNWNINDTRVLNGDRKGNYVDFFKTGNITLKMLTSMLNAWWKKGRG